MRPEDILNDPSRNKGTAFTQKERDALKLNGFLPYHTSSLEEQVEKRYQNFKAQESDLSKWAFLNALQNRNELLFHRLVSEHIEEMLPFVYTPTVGDVSLNYSLLYTQQRGIYFSYPLQDRISEIVANIPTPERDVVVITDGERILGLGDLGAGGMAIPVGKLILYTLFGGIHPARTLPVTLDVGTNNPNLLNDPHYLGWHHERVAGEAYDTFVDHVVQALKKRYPRVLLQWEDFGKDHARPLLERYADQICSFNDDIQGTAAVVCAALLGAVKRTKKPLQEQKIVVFGGGSAGIGICEGIVGVMQEHGIAQDVALKSLYVIDVQGLVHTGQSQIPPHQHPFARPKEEVAAWPNMSLLEVVRRVQPTVLIGVSAQAGTFTEEIVTAMACTAEYPIIFPLSNPTSKSEARPTDLIRWTQGKALVATGSPFEPVTYNGKRYPIAQCNNVYIFPGVGLGLIACRSKKATARMFYKAAHILSEHSLSGSLFPPFGQLREISRKIACQVIQVAQDENLAPKTTPQEIEAMVTRILWTPTYGS
jgi:malate dehydrogenase (oxaloacetate-decarboxylating)